MKGRLSDDAALPMTIVNPPPIQEMNAANDHNDNRDSAPSSEKGSEHTKLEMQALQWHHVNFEMEFLCATFLFFGDILRGTFTQTEPENVDIY